MQRVRGEWRVSVYCLPGPGPHLMSLLITSKLTSFAADPLIACGLPHCYPCGLLEAGIYPIRVNRWLLSSTALRTALKTSGNSWRKPGPFLHRLGALGVGSMCYTGVSHGLGLSRYSRIKDLHCYHLLHKLAQY